MPESAWLWRGKRVSLSQVAGRTAIWRGFDGAHPFVVGYVAKVENGRGHDRLITRDLKGVQTPEAMHRTRKQAVEHFLDTIEGTK